MTGWDPVHDARRAFRACLSALSAPGDAIAGVPPGAAAWLANGTSPADATLPPAVDAAVAVLVALLDPGLTLAVAGSLADDDLGAALCARTGASRAPLAEADFVLVLDGAPAGSASAARRGSVDRPDRGATLVYAGGWERHDFWVSDPGSGAQRSVALLLPPGEVHALNAANAHPPLGVDAFVLDDDHVVALPRRVRVVEAVQSPPKGTGRA